MQAQGGTRDQFLEAATQLFAERGFYGVSLANIADQLGLTKQALIHHFGTKEKLYGHVLAQISDRFLGAVHTAQQAPLNPEQRVHAFFAGFYAHSMDNPEDTRLILRELLDNRQRAEQASVWYLKPFLQTLIRMVQATARHRHSSDAQALAVAYQALGAICFFVISETTLTRMFGEKTFDEVLNAFPPELDRLVRQLIA